MAVQRRHAAPTNLWSCFWWFSGAVYVILVRTACSGVLHPGGPQNGLFYQLGDETPRNTVIGNIVADAKLRQNFTPAVLDTLQFEILGGQFKDYFVMDYNSGDLKTNRTLVDRDVLCPRKPECNVHLDVAIVRPLNHFHIFKVTITLEDANDNAPSFSRPLTTVRISESALPGVGFVLPSAEDPDSGNFGINYYLMVTRTTTFGLRELENTDGSKDVRLELKERLNREKQDFYSLEVQAVDGGDEQRYGTLVVEVLVMDANDNSPVFEEAVYNISLLENTPVDSVLTTVHADDEDEGANGEVVYGFAPQTQALFGDVFDIDNQTGQVYLRSPLDYEQIQSYHLLVTASDLGPDSVPANAKVILNVMDVNDYAPKISVNSWSATGGVEVSENKPPGEFVAHVAVEDLDQGASGVVTCTIPNTEFDLQQIYPGTYKVITASVFDREAADIHRFNIECQDLGESPLRTTQSVSVAILDDNDHDPEFEQPAYTVSIPETTGASVSILQVRAEDEDIGTNAEISYHLHANSKNLLRIDSHSGVITTKAKFNYETLQEFEFSVLAIDHGTAARSATTTVHLNILDVNDEPPVFSQASYNFGTFENQVPETEIGTVSAKDSDSAPFNKFTLSLTEINGHSTPTFTIDSHTGKITTRKVLDREHQSAYYLVVKATDTAPPNLSASVSVTVYVADRNDNAPRIEYPTEGNNTVEVSIFSPIGYIISRVAANDLDLGNNAQLTYSIGKYNEDKLFAMDSITGAVFINRELSEVTQYNHQLLLLVKDQGEPQKSATTVLNIVINNTESFALAQDIVLDLGMGDDEDALGHHQKILIILGAVTAVLVCILITAIVFIKWRQQRLRHKEHYKYMCRVDLSQQVRQPPGSSSQPDPDATSTSSPQHSSSTQALSADQKRVSFDMHNGEDNISFTAPFIDEKHQCEGMMREQQLDAMQRVDSSGRNSLHAVPPGGTSLPQQLLQDRHMEMQQILDLIKHQERDSDSTSGCSADMSNSDSGRGPSEESEHTAAPPAAHHCDQHWDQPNQRYVTPCAVHGKVRRPHVMCPLKSCDASHLATSGHHHSHQPSHHGNQQREAAVAPPPPARPSKRQADTVYPLASRQPLEMKTFGYSSSQHKPAPSGKVGTVTQPADKSDDPSRSPPGHVVMIDSVTTNYVNV